jgi:hypothetical protein
MEIAFLTPEQRKVLQQIGGNPILDSHSMIPTKG